MSTDLSRASVNMRHGMDWECDPSELSGQAAFIRGIDWESTELGPPSQWPAQLLQAVDFMLTDPTAAAVMWGDRLTMIYNEGFCTFAGTKHPTLMGRSPITEYAEVWDMFVDIIEKGRTLGQATSHKDVQLFLNRYGSLEECYVTYTFVPLLGSDKTVVGFYHTAHETTSEILRTRRTRTLLAISGAVSSARSLTEYWTSLLSTLKSNGDDIKFALSYTCAIDDGAHSSPASFEMPKNAKLARVSKICTFAGATMDNTDLIPEYIDSRINDDPLVAAIESAITTGEATKLHNTDPGVPSWLFDLDTTAGEQQCRTVLVIPVRSSSLVGGTSHNLIGFLIVGLSPFLRYDEDFTQFIQLCSRQMSTAANSILLLEQERRRQEHLMKQLSSSTQQAKETEKRFLRFTEMSNIGMWIASNKGELLYANDAWYKQAELDPNVEDMTVEKWTPLVTDESLADFAHHWGLLMQHGQSVTFECQFKARWRSHDPVTGELREGPRWFLISALPEFNDDGTLKSTWGCNVDVSFQKWAQEREQARLQETLEAKRHTERFLEFLSHELRNPLSAILQSADDIASTVDAAVLVNSAQDGVTIEETEICSVSESISTIINCTQHQKRIMDDILTLSKLDARLLPVTVVEVDPRATIRHALNLHQQQFKSAQVTGAIKVDNSYDQLEIDKVLLDPSRLLQVLINLLTNAIKFTQFQPTRVVTLHLAASARCPSDMEDDIQYFSPRADARIVVAENNGSTPDCISGDDVYLQFAVEDTGCGLNSEEMQRLFTRFTQASPKTHVKYGGSGLGLFICKELTELQGGRIGVTSVTGKGSTFKFFIKVKRVVSVDEAAEANAEKLEQITIEADHHEDEAGQSVKDLRNGNYRHALNRSEHSATSNPIVGSLTDADALHILVVEDNLINQKVMANQLRKAKCIVHVADHGGHALLFLKKTTFAKDCGPDAIPLSLVLMDIEMPVMSGLECIGKIREMQHTGELTRPVPVIAVTANARMEQITEAKKHGMDDVVTKPFRIKELLPIMRNLIKQVSV